MEEVAFEVALTLMKKGYSENEVHYWLFDPKTETNSTQLQKSYDRLGANYNAKFNQSENCGYASAPTIFKTVIWLQTKHNIFVSVTALGCRFTKQMGFEGRFHTCIIKDDESQKLKVDEFDDYFEAWNTVLLEAVNLI